MDRRLLDVAERLRPGVPMVSKPFPPTPTPWAAVYGLSWSGDQDRCVVRLISPETLVAEDVRIEFAAARLLAEHGIGPLVRHLDAESGVLVMDYVEGAPARPALAWQAASVADLLARLHAVPWTGPPPQLHVQKRREANEAVRLLVQRIPRLELYGEALGSFDALRAHMRVLETPAVLCHNDLNPSNILFDDERAWFLDFDHVGYGDPLFDVATAISALDLDYGLAEAFLHRYLGRPPTETERARLELLGCLVLLRYGLSTLSLVPPHLQTALAGWSPADVGAAFVFDKREGEELGWSVLRLSLGFITAGLARSTAHNARTAMKVLGLPTSAGKMVGTC